MSMKKVRITIGGIPYNIATDEDTGYTEKLAREIDGRINELMTGSYMSPDQAQTIVMLELADIAKKATSENELVKSQLKEYLADAAQAKSERDMLKRELAKIKKNGKNEVI